MLKVSLVPSIVEPGPYRRGTSTGMKEIRKDKRGKMREDKGGEK